MPLPQELRPPEVLHATMNYLLSYIIDTGGQGKWTEWYDFLWNRTRSIRKVRHNDSVVKTQFVDGFSFMELSSGFLERERLSEREEQRRGGREHQRAREQS